MSDLIAAIGIIVLGILATIGSIFVVQVVFSRPTQNSQTEREDQVKPEEFVLESLHSLPAEISAEQIAQINHDLQKRYHLSAADAEETLNAVIRSSAFERVTGARCTCYDESKQYGKYFHAPSCEYRQFLEEMRTG
jgi:hypothetical protein